MKDNIHQKAKRMAETMVQDIKEDAEKKVKRVVTFAGSSMFGMVLYQYAAERGTS